MAGRPLGHGTLAAHAEAIIPRYLAGERLSVLAGEFGGTVDGIRTLMHRRGVSRPRRGLTVFQRKVLAFIRSRAVPPTMREIALALGLKHRNSAWCAVMYLEEHGCLRRGSGWREIEVTPKGMAA